MMERRRRCGLDPAIVRLASRGRFVGGLGEGLVEEKGLSGQMRSGGNVGVKSQLDGFFSVF